MPKDVECDSCGEHSEGYTLCRGCLLNAERAEAARARTREIVHRALGGGGMLEELPPHATRDEVIEWIQNEFLYDSEGESS